jgi:hypothetical protein
VVLLSSRLGLVCVTACRFLRKGVHGLQSRFYRRYARKLPSSLTRDHSSTLAYSASLPVSVCGTGTWDLRSRLFSTVWGQSTRGACCHAHLHSLLGQQSRDLLRDLPTSLDGARLAARSTRPHPAFVKRSLRGTGLSPCCPSVVTCEGAP